MMLRFRNVDVSNLGPFKSGQQICLQDGFTLVVGDNGSGKTTFAKELLRQYAHHEMVVGEGSATYVPAWIALFSDDVDLPYGGEPWRDLGDLVASDSRLSSRRDEFNLLLGIRLQEILGNKIRGLSSKFLGVVDRPKQLDISVADDGAISIFGNDGKPIEHCFQAAGERVALYLATNSAVRTLLSLDVPFVACSVLGRLDSWLLPSCFEFIKNMSNQTILLESCAAVEHLRTAPNYRLSVNPASSRSIVSRVG